ncbi:hypothetical protein A6A05_12300 [Magnetospirillum moscoviense]|uniref:Uncharacterized protein n=2 Tax=Magnetospirillum moscoviense TaxID=1437059 RepID=A0A178MR72_9PROT|nr:hypothetical protein A6A05_12300 [Magnetospirillum moscoviense]
MLPIAKRIAAAQTGDGQDGLAEAQRDQRVLLARDLVASAYYRDALVIEELTQLAEALATDSPTNVGPEDFLLNMLMAMRNHAAGNLPVIPVQTDPAQAGSAGCTLDGALAAEVLAANGRVEAGMAKADPATMGAVQAQVKQLIDLGNIRKLHAVSLAMYGLHVSRVGVAKTDDDLRAANGSWEEAVAKLDDRGRFFVASLNMIQDRIAGPSIVEELLSKTDGTAK